MALAITRQQHILNSPCGEFKPECVFSWERLVGKGRFELPTSRSRTVHSNLAELLPEAAQSTTGTTEPLSAHA